MIAEEKKLNATYIVSVARKLGCSIFLLPEDIMEVKSNSNCNSFIYLYRVIDLISCIETK